MKHLFSHWLQLLSSGDMRPCAGASSPFSSRVVSDVLADIVARHADHQRVLGALNQVDLRHTENTGQR